MFGMLLRWLIFIKYSDGENEISIWIVKTDPVHVSLIVQYCKQMGSVKWYEYKPGGRLNKKDGLTRYGNSHVKDKTS